MKTTVERIKPTRAKLVIEANSDDLKPSIDHAYEHIAEEVSIPGFRKGKVPLAILKKQFGQRILGDAMQDAIDGAMKDHFDKTGDRPAMQPDVKMVGGETWKEGQDVVVEMTYE